MNINLHTKEKIVYCLIERIIMKVIFNQTAVHDYPKKAGGMHFAWYCQGKICICRKKSEPCLQTQNVKIKDVNHVVHSLWQELKQKSKVELQKYASLYKKRYPSIRKRGNNAYSIFLMICHALIKVNKLSQIQKDDLLTILRNIISGMTIYQMVSEGILKRVKNCHQLKLQLLGNDDILLENKALEAIGFYDMNKSIIKEFFRVELSKEVTHSPPLRIVSRGVAEMLRVF